MVTGPDMTASELIVTLQAMIAEHGDRETFCVDDGGIADIRQVEYIEKFELPPAFLIS